MSKQKRAGARYRRKDDARPLIRRGGLCYPKCEPGTIGYHDMLVRKYGRKKADEIGRWIQGGKFERVPNAEQLAAREDWAWRAA